MKADTEARAASSWRHKVAHAATPWNWSERYYRLFVFLAVVLLVATLAQPLFVDSRRRLIGALVEILLVVPIFGVSLFNTLRNRRARSNSAV